MRVEDLLQAWSKELGDFAFIHFVTLTQFCSETAQNGRMSGKNHTSVAKTYA